MTKIVSNRKLLIIERIKRNERINGKSIYVSGLGTEQGK